MSESRKDEFDVIELGDRVATEIPAPKPRPKPEPETGPRNRRPKHVTLRTLVAGIAGGAILMAVSVAGASSSPPELSPEYSWPVGVEKAVQAAQVQAASIDEPDEDDYVIAEPLVVSVPEVEVRPPFVVETATPSGYIYRAHVNDLGTPRPNADTRTLRCEGGSWGSGATVPASSMDKVPGQVDALIASGQCTVVQ